MNKWNDAIIYFHGKVTNTNVAKISDVPKTLLPFYLCFKPKELFRPYVYELLKRNLTHGQIATRTGLKETEVRSIARRFNLSK